MLKVFLRIIMLILSALSTSHLFILLLHRLGRVDARKWRWMRVVEKPKSCPRSFFVRTVIALAAVTASFVLCCVGLMEDEPWWYLLFAAFMVGYARCWRGQRTLRGFFDTVPHGWQRTTIVVTATILLCFIALEFPSNPIMAGMFQKPIGIIVEFTALILIALILWLLLARRRYGLILSVLVCCVFGIVEYYIASFKDMPLLPSDVLAFGTAAAVGFNYLYVISGRVLMSVCCVLACEFLTSTVDLPHPRRKRTVLLNYAMCALCVALATCGVTFVDFVNDLDITVRAWSPLKDYRMEGFIPAFISGAQSIVPTQPWGYWRPNIPSLMEGYAQQYDEGIGSTTRRRAAERQFEQVQPSVIVIMNETFCDLSIFDELHADYPGPRFYRSIDDALYKGTLYVSAYGGGTCNTEFEFLTSNSMNFIGASVYPYMTYNLDGVASISQHFADLGYDTWAMHPNLATNWNRNIIYPELGFGTFLSLDDFSQSRRFRGLVSDWGTYETILDILESSDNPQFVFDVTMQNHSSYTTGLVPEWQRTDYDPSDVGDSLNDELNEYLACIEQSDIALNYLLTSLQRIDRPVVVVFFGDHQPYFTGTYNNDFFPDEGNLEHTMRLWRTDYLVWANYDVAGASELDHGQDISVNFLGPAVLDAIGAPLTPLMKAQMSLHQQLQSVNLIGYQGADGQFYWNDDASSPYHRAYQDLGMIQYRYFFDFPREDGLYMTSTSPGTTRPDD